MNIKDILLAPRYGIYRPGTGTLDFELTSYVNGFRLSTSMELAQDQSYQIVKDNLTKYLDQATVYLDEKDLKLVAVLLNATAQGLSYAIDFDTRGITLASLITVDARKVQFIYEKYSPSEYALQLSLTRGSSIKFAWSDSLLKGDFYFNLKRSGAEDITTVTGYTNFHLGNADAAKPVVISAGVVKRKFIADPNKETEKEDKENVDKKAESKVEDHTYVQLRSRSAKGITVKDIISMFISLPDNDKEDRIPDALDNVSFYDFAILSRKSISGDKEIHDFAIVIDCDFVISGKKLKTKLTIHTSKVKGGESKSQSFSFSGLVTVDQHQFELKFAKSKTTSTATDSTGDNSSWSIQASYSKKGDVTLDIQRMLKSLFGDGVDVPEMSLKLKEPKAFFIYQKSKVGDKATSKYLFGAGAGIDLKIGQLPIAGSVLVKMNALEFKEVFFTYGNNEMTADDLKPLISSKVLPKETKKISQGLSLTAEIVIDGKSELYTFGGAVTKNAQKDTKNAAENNNIDIIVTDADIKDHDIPRGENEKDNNDTKELPSGATTGANWYIIDKQLGPVNFQRIGFKYHEGRAYVFIDASVKTSALSLSMMGLGVGFKPDWDDLKPSFHLKGLGLSYKTDTVEISGAFLRGQQTMMIDGQSQTIDTYNGAAMLKMKKFSISAIGSYAEYMEQEQKKTSLFVYGVFLGNIGGPPIFYVTGIAAGFGYNRKINAPEITDVADYPLVALAMSGENKSLGDVLSSLETPMSNGKLPIDISPGNYWLALGVKFTSFKIIESFVLVTVNFGLKTEFNILGLSRLSFPEKSFRDKIGMAAPIIYIELAIKISYTVGGEVFTVDGLITPESYLFSRNCRLTGGFAFYVWVAGEHAGDFVLTLGGYFPNKKMPAHYPQVPRIQLLWMLSDSIMIKGQLYFALTPSSIMMGGRWELHVTTTNVKVSVILWLDILLEWAPFYYEISMGLIFRIEAHIPMKICTIHINLELKAQLDLWGPDFSGKALLDLGVISFEVGFGKTPRGGKKTIQFDAFTNQFLPKSKDDPKTFDTISIQPDGGVINILENGQNKEKYYVVNPLQASIQIDSNVPVTHASFNSSENMILQEEFPAIDRLGIKPCGVGMSSAPQAASTSGGSNHNKPLRDKLTDQVFELSMTVDVKYNGKPSKDSFKSSLNAKAYPKALWSHPDESGDSPDTMLQNIPSGFQLTPSEAPKVAELKPYDFSTFKEEWKNEGKEIVTFRKLTASPHTDFDGSQYLAEGIVSQRNQLINDAAALFFGDETYQIDTIALVDVYSQNHGTYFRNLPKTCSIGQVPNKSFTS